MTPTNRDLLVLTKFFNEGSPLHLQEVEMLNRILKTVENFSVFCGANEIFFFFFYERGHRPYIIEEMVMSRVFSPFIFFINKN